MSELKPSQQAAPVKGGDADAVLEAQLRALVSASADHDPEVVVPALVKKFGGFQNSTTSAFSIKSLIFYSEVTLNADRIGKHFKATLEGVGTSGGSSFCLR
jgi:hypothetical protein